jgi:hypothetical protein
MSIIETQHRQQIIKRLASLKQEYQNVMLQNIQNAIDQVTEVAIDLESSLYRLDPSGQNPSYSISEHENMVKLDQNIRQMIKEKHCNELAVAIMTELTGKIQNAEIELDQVSECFHSVYKERMALLLVNPKDYEHDENYKQFREGVFKVRNPDKEFSFGDFEDRDDEDDIRMVNATLVLHCPITVLSF